MEVVVVAVVVGDDDGVVDILSHVVVVGTGCYFETTHPGHDGGNSGDNHTRHILRKLGRLELMSVTA